MPRTISSAGLAKLATQYGTEPINIIEIQWVVDGTRIAYSDRDIDGVAKGSILSISGLDDVVQVSGGSASQQISLTLDDTDGTIKAIMDANDIHKRNVWVYQWFDGIDPSDKFLVFKGVINTPIDWNEGDRTLSIDVISKIEDVEVGFSMEEGDFTNPPEALIGKAWPLVFGTVTNVPALRGTTVRSGILAQGTGIHDFTLEARIAAINKVICPQNFVGFRAHNETSAASGPWGGGPLVIEPIYEEDPSCIKSKCEQREMMKLQLSEQKAYEITPVIIFGGEKFPQNTTITLNINNGKFIGKFTGESFAITGRMHPDNDGSGKIKISETQATIDSRCGTNTDPTAGVANDDGNGVPGWTPTLLAKKSKESWDVFNAIKSSSFFWANAGASVAIDSDEEIIYIANLLPSTILRVAAFRELQGGRQLLTVPDTYYTIRQTNYTGYTGVMEIVFNKPLSRQDLTNGGGWSDDIYVTLTSSEGPNTVDILEWFITTYTQYTVDATSFNAVRTLIDNYPMHFALLERKNIINVLEEIAYQARCALWLKDDVFYIKYLALEPANDETIGESDVIANSLKILHTSTEDLVTKYIAEWKKDYALDKPNTVILRHNVSKYGTHEERYNYYCYNIIDLVRKSATFWLIRKANTWRKLAFRTPLHKLKLETFDTVGITLPDLGPGEIKCVVEKANYNSDSQTIDFEVWTPCKSGTTSPYMFAWPADVEETDLFPTLEERRLGLAGSGQHPNFTVIAPTSHPFSNDNSGFFSGFNLTCNGSSTKVDLRHPDTSGQANSECRPDHGTKKPSDRGDTKPTPDAPSGGGGGVSVGSSPINSGSNCCSQAAEAMQKANQALAEAQKAREEAQTASGQGKQGEGKKTKPQSEAEKDLPEKGGANDGSGNCSVGSCEAYARIDFIKVSLVLKDDGSFGNMEGDSGQIINGQIGSHFECVIFNSAVAAQQYRNGKVAETTATSDAYGCVVGEEYAWVTSTASADLGTVTDPNAENFGEVCPEPGAEDQAMTGKSSSDTPPPPTSPTVEE